jgi:repressor LexA
MPREARKSPDAFDGPFCARITRRMEAMGMTKLEQFAEFSGIGATTVYGLVQGRVSRHGTAVKPSLETLSRLADALEVPLHELVYDLEPSARGAGEASDRQVVRLPVHVAGWVGAGPDQDEPIQDHDVWVDANFARGRDLLAFRIRGDSMESGPQPILHGDVVLVNRNDKGHDGSAVVARLDSDAYVCKLLRSDKSGWMLASANPGSTDGTPPFIGADEVAEVVGRVIEIRHVEIGGRDLR